MSIYTIYAKTMDDEKSFGSPMNRDLYPADAYDDDYDPAESLRKDMARERKICPICDSGNGHSLSCATLNVAGDVVELDAIEIQDSPDSAPKI